MNLTRAWAFLVLCFAFIAIYIRTMLKHCPEQRSSRTYVTQTATICSTTIVAVCSVLQCEHVTHHVQNICSAAALQCLRIPRVIIRSKTQALLYCEVSMITNLYLGNFYTKHLFFLRIKNVSFHIS
jgi:hypothetical protein